MTTVVTNVPKTFPSFGENFTLKLNGKSITLVLSDIDTTYGNKFSGRTRSEELTFLRRVRRASEGHGYIWELVSRVPKKLPLAKAA